MAAAVSRKWLRITTDFSSGNGRRVLCGCAAQPAANKAPAQQAVSILISSSPAAGSTVSGPVDELMLHFNPPARLIEVTVNGPQGLMPMMVTAAGGPAIIRCRCRGWAREPMR